MNNRKVYTKSISTRTLIILFLLFPPVGLYMLAKYRAKNIKKPLVIVGITAYIFLGVLCVSLSGAYIDNVEPLVWVDRIEVTEEIPFETENKTDGVATAGVNGKKVVTYQIKYQYNTEISRIILNEKIIEGPVTEIKITEAAGE